MIYIAALIRIAYLARGVFNLRLMADEKSREYLFKCTTHPDTRIRVVAAELNANINAARRLATPILLTTPVMLSSPAAPAPTPALPVVKKEAVTSSTHASPPRPPPRRDRSPSPRRASSSKNKKKEISNDLELYESDINNLKPMGSNYFMKKLTALENASLVSKRGELLKSIRHDSGLKFITVRKASKDSARNVLMCGTIESIRIAYSLIRKC